MTTRTDQRLTWGTNQLFRRPSPVSGGATRPWVVLENLGQTIPTGVSKFSLFTDVTYDPLLVEGGTMSSLFEFSIQSEDGQDYWELTTKVEGWYTFEYISFWGNFSTPPATEGYALEFISFITTGIPFNLDKNNREAKDWSTGSVNGLEAAARLNLYRTVWLPVNKGWDQVKLQQTSGSSRDVSAQLKVWYEAGNFGGSDDNADWITEVV